MLEFINKSSVIANRPKEAIKTGAFKLGDKEFLFQYNRVNGEIQTFELDRPIGEMITSERQEYFIKQVYLDIDLAREQEAELWQPIYDIITDSSFPETFKAKWIQEGKVVFLRHVEGAEIDFGTRDAREGDTANIVTWAAGFEYTEDMVLYNQTWQMAEFNKAMGTAHAALLNHIHLSPILDYTYTAANQTAASTIYDSPAYPDWDTYSRQVMNTRQTLIDAVKATRVKPVDNLPNRPGTLLLIHSSNEQLIADAIGQPPIVGIPKHSPIAGIKQVVSYDGWSSVVGNKTTTYAGCPTTKAYLIMPKKYFKALVKHDLRIDVGNPDLSRLVEKQIVGRCRRGVYAGIERSVEEITLP